MLRNRVVNAEDPGINMNHSAMETNDLWTTTLSTRPDMVFQEVNAIITPGYLKQLSDEPDQLLARLNTETGIKIEKVELGDGSAQFNLRGALDQIILSKMKLEKMMVDKQMLTIALHNQSQLAPATNPILNGKDNWTNDKSQMAADVCSSKEINSRSRRKVFKPRKVSLDIINVKLEDGSPQENSPSVLDYQNNNQPRNNITETPASLNQGENVDHDVEPSLVLPSLEEEAERKATEWLSIPDFLPDMNDSVSDEQMEPNPNTLKPQARYVYSCELCSFKAEREGQFLKHVLTHSKRETVHQCRKCSFASVSLSHYNRHQLTHSDATFNCPECDFTSDDPKLLARHVTLKHTITDNPLKRSSLLQCNDCPYNTTKIYHFERHLLVHNRDLKGLLQVHQCEQCPYKTHRKEHIIRHRHNVHIRHRPYSCNSCHRTYKNVDSLHQHQQQVHSSS